MKQSVFDSSAVRKSGELPLVVKPAVGTEALVNVDAQTLEDSYVYVHCYFNNVWKNMLIRIWKTTYLADSVSSFRAKLIHAENISLAPVWTQIPDGKQYTFLLIFSGLPKSCTQFDLIEEISEPGGFLIQTISRNETDVYHIDLK